MWTVLVRRYESADLVILYCVSVCVSDVTECVAVLCFSVHDWCGVLL